MRKVSAKVIREQLDDHDERIKADHTPLPVRVFYGPDCVFDEMTLGKDDDRIFAELGIL